MIRFKDEALPKPVTKTPRTVTEIRALRKVGRPRKPKALSSAEKQRAYRERKKANG